MVLSVIGSVRQTLFFKKMKEINSLTKKQFYKTLIACGKEKEQILPFLKSYVDHARNNPSDASIYYENDKVLIYAILLLQNCFNDIYRSDEVFLTKNEKDIISSDPNYFKQRKVRKEKSY